MNIPAAFDDITPRGTANDELVTPPLVMPPYANALDISDENNEIISAGSHNGANEEELNSPDSLLGLSATDFMQIQNIFQDITEMPTISEVKEEKKVLELTIEKDNKIEPLSNEAMHHGPSQRTNVIQGQELVTHNRFVPNQPPLGRGYYNQRSSNSSQVNGEVRSFTQVIYSAQNQNNGIMVQQDRVKRVKSETIKEQSELFYASGSVSGSSCTEYLPYGMDPGSVTRVSPMTADMTQWVPVEHMRSIKRTYVPNAGSRRVEKAAPIPEQHILQEPTSSHQSRLSKRKYSAATEYSYPKVTQKLPNIVHQAGNNFYASTSCDACRKKSEHILYKPGHWPPSQCPNCGGKCNITDWYPIVDNSDDEIICLGRFEPSIKPERHINNVNPVYRHAIVKVEPREMVYNTASCHMCGGHHVSSMGGPQSAAFCPNYAAMRNLRIANWN